MRKKSKLAQTDDLINDLTLAVASRIVERRKLIEPSMHYSEIKNRCDCITIFGRNLQALREIRSKVQKLRREGKLSFSSELHRALVELSSLHIWSSFRPGVDITERIEQILWG